VESLAGHYRLAIHPTVAISSLAGVYADVLEEHPQLKCELIFSTSREALKKVVSHEVDLAVVVKPEDHPELVIRPFIRKKFFCTNLKRVLKRRRALRS
jgi:DNA-binding transcriptional LysR family regulator